MTILDSELRFYKSAVVSDEGSNGGRMGIAQIISGMSNNVWPNVFKAERLAGSTKYRKLFLKVANDDDLKLYNPLVWLDIPTVGDDWIVFFGATQLDTQAEIPVDDSDPETNPRYGCASLAEDVLASADIVIVTVEDLTLVSGDDQIFRIGEKIRITNKETIDSGTGTEEEHIIGNITWDSLTGTITLDGTTLANAYTVLEGSRVMSLYEPGDVSCTISNWVENGSGTYNEATYPVLGDNIGTIEQTWTLTFSSATAYTVVGNTIGSVGSGTVSVNFAPSNPNFTKPYFTIPYLGFGGTWTAANTIAFQTHPASIPVWEKRVIPPDCASLTGNKTTMCCSGESE